MVRNIGEVCHGLVAIVIVGAHRKTGLKGIIPRENCRRKMHSTLISKENKQRFQKVGRGRGPPRKKKTKDLPFKLGREKEGSGGL